MHTEPSNWRSHRLPPFAVDRCRPLMSVSAVDVRHGVFSNLRMQVTGGARACRILDRQRVMVRQRADCPDTWIVLLFRVSYQYVAGPVMTQPVSVGLTRKPNATSMICAW